LQLLAGCRPSLCPLLQRHPTPACLPAGWLVGAGLLQADDVLVMAGSGAPMGATLG